MLPLVVSVAAVCLVATWIVYTHNLLVRMRNKVDEAFSGIDVQLKRRHDLVPNLTRAVSAYTRHERVSLAMIVDARSRADRATTPAQVDAAEKLLTTNLRGLLAVAEQYPELRATQSFTEMINELVDLENEIRAARSLYNQNVQVLSSYAQSFPALLVARFTRDTEFPYLRFEGVEQEAARLIGTGFAA